MKLHTYAGNVHALQSLIVARYNGVEIELPPFEMGKDNKTKAFLAKSPMGKVPVLETPEGCICEAGAIARYVARIRADTPPHKWSEHAAKTYALVAAVARERTRRGADAEFFVLGQFRPAEASRPYLHSAFALGVYDCAHLVPGP